LLGGTETVERMPAYASLLRYGNADIVRQNSAKAVARGYASVKLHEIGAAEITAAREAISPDTVLTVDASCAWTLPQASDMAKRLRPCNLTWLEEPLWPPEDYAGLARLKAEGGGTTPARTPISRNSSTWPTSITFSRASPRSVASVR
jgi:D-galactarolactone cycloisomerase